MKRLMNGGYDVLLHFHDVLSLVSSKIFAIIAGQPGPYGFPKRCLSIFKFIAKMFLYC
jgi:hypothetical protein